MEILYDNKEVKEFLKAWGIDMELMRSVTIHISKDHVAIVTVEKLTQADPQKLQDTMIEKYYLMKKNETNP